MAIGGECLVALAAAAAAQLAVGRTEDELVVWAAFLTSLADNLALIAAQRAALENACTQCANQVQLEKTAQKEETKNEMRRDRPGL